MDVSPLKPFDRLKRLTIILSESVDQKSTDLSSEAAGIKVNVLFLGFTHVINSHVFQRKQKKTLR